MKPRILVLANEKSENYVKAIEACNSIAVPKYLPDISTDFDGLLLCGGSDILPSYYGQEINGAKGFDVERDRTEMELTKVFLDTGKPILGICRGLQLLNVVLGGTLIQDLSNKEAHASSSGDLVHPIMADGFLKELYQESFYVNSSHHQAINTLGNGLIATAWDGSVIEAIQHKDKPYFAVQFHPERMCLDHQREDTVDGLKIFEFFINLCKNS